jgi:TRAP-type C4-dicarboxylate transport system substrate-binding protein
MAMKWNLKVLTIGLVAAVASLSSSVQAQTVLTYSSWLPWTHPVNTAIYLPWMEAVEKDSQGRIQFRKLPKPVASPPAHLDAVRTGQADVAMSVHGYEPKRFAAYMFAELPMLGDTAVATSVALQRTHDKLLAGKGFYAGVHVIGMNTHGPGLIHHRKKHILAPEDMKGQKVRTGGPVPQSIVEAWGGVAIKQPAPKSYEILSTGVADGITFPYESLGSFNITKLVPFSTYIPGGMYSSSHYLVMNKAKYDALSAQDKAVIDKHSGEAFAKMAGMGWDKINDEGKRLALEAGNAIKVAPQGLIDAVKATMAPLEADYVKNARDVGVDGAALLTFFHGEVAKLSGAR